MSNGPHLETCIKVNARVDVGIAPLVTALNEFEAVETIESCQGGEGHQAFVVLRLGSWRDCGAFLFDQLLAMAPTDLRADCSFELIGYDPSNCLGRIAVTPEAVEALTAVVRSVRRCECCDGS